MVFGVAQRLSLELLVVAEQRYTHGHGLSDFWYMASKSAPAQIGDFI